MTIEIRPLSGYADLERWTATRNEVHPDDPDDPGMLALIRATELDRVDLIACEEGEVLGTGMLAGDPTSAEARHPYVEVTVPAQHRGRGVGAALLGELSERARRLGKEGLECEARADDAYSIAFLERRGFVELGRAAKYALDLSGYEGPDPSQTEGVELVMLADRPDLLTGMYEVAKATYPEIGGYQAKQAESAQAWQLYHLGSPGAALDMTPIAIADGEVIGFATLTLHTDRRTAEHRMAAVRADWRRRGIATLLLHAQLGAAKHAGVETVIAWGRDGHEGSTYGGRLGFEPCAETIAFRGPLQ